MSNQIVEAEPVKKVKELSLHRISDEIEFKAMSSEWQVLHKEAGTPVFMSFDWIDCWWEHFGKHKHRKLHVLCIREDGQLIAIAPLYEGYSVLLGKSFQKRLSLMGDGTGKNESLDYTDHYGRSDFLDFIVKPGKEEEVTSRLIRHFAESEYDRFDYFRATHISDRSFICRYFIPGLEKMGKSIQLSETDICPYIEMTDSYEDTYLYDVSSNTRRRLRQSIKAIGKEDGYEVYDIEDEATLMNEYEHMRDMHQERWNKIGYPGAFFDRRFDLFMKEYITRGFKKGNLLFRYATDSGGRCASRMALVDNGRCYDYMGSFDYDAPSSKYRPGIGLLVKMIMDGHEKGWKSVELLRGDEAYKFDLTSKQIHNWQLIIPLGAESNIIRKTGAAFIKGLSKIYLLIKKETTLMKVHGMNRGLAGMIRSYTASRFEQVKIRLKK